MIQNYLNVVVSKLAVLVIVHAKKLGFFGGAEVKTRDKVDALGDESRHDERISHGGANIGNLNVQLLIVVVDKAAGNFLVDTIQADDVISSKETVEDQTDNASESVFSEYIESVVDANNELDLGAEVTNNSSNDSENDAGPGRDITGSGCSGDETRDGTGTPADERPLLGEAVIEKGPGHGRKHGCKARVPARHGGTKVGAESRSAVEAEPAEPEEDGTDGDQRDVVRTEVEHHLLVTAAEDPRISQSRDTGSDFDGTTTSIIHHSVLESPSIDVPSPAAQRAVDQCRPDEDEDHCRDNATTFGGGSNNEGCGYAEELHLS